MLWLNFKSASQETFFPADRCAEMIATRYIATMLPLRHNRLPSDTGRLLYGPDSFLNRCRRPFGNFLSSLLAAACIFLLLTPKLGAGKNLQIIQGLAFSQSDAVVLPAGTRLDLEIAGGEKQAFSIQVEAKQFIRIALDQRGFLFSVKVIASNGTTILEGVTPNALSEVTRFSCVSQDAGNYRIEIAHVRKQTTSRPYTLQIEDQRDAKPEDQDRVLADKLSLEAGSLLAALSADNLRAASLKYQTALELWKKLKVPYETAQTLLTLGSIAHNLSEPAAALEYYDQSLLIWRQLKNSAKEAQTLSALGWTYFGSGDLSNALENYNQALPIRRQLHDIKGQAQTLTTLGQVHNALGEPQLAIDNYGQALTLARQAGDKIQQAFALNNFAYMYGNLGDYQKALNCLDEAVPLWRETGNRYGEADAMNSYGVIYDRLGDYDRALDFYSLALKIWRYLGNRGGEADALNNIGVLMLSSELQEDSVQSALSYLNQALEVRRSIGHGLGEDSTLVSIGVAYLYLGQPEKAEPYLKDLLSRKPNYPWALHDMGFSYFLKGEFSSAIEYLKRALVLFRERENIEGQAQTLRLLAASQEDTGQLIEARENAMRAVALAESSRSQIVDPESRMMHRGRTSTFPVVLIQILSRLNELHPNSGYDAEAFEVSERARARGLLETLLRAQVDLSTNADAYALAREHALALQLKAKEQYRTRLLITKGKEAQLLEVEQEIASLTAQHREARSSVLKSSPKYAALIEPNTLSVKETQSLLDPDTVLLEYQLGEERSYLWEVSAGSFKMHILPKKRLIHLQARRFYDLLTERNVRRTAETPEDRVTRIARADLELEDAATTLSKTLLGPISSNLPMKRLVVVTEGILQYIPFAALPIPRRTNGSPANTAKLGQPLMNELEVVSLPSASVLGVLRQEALRRQVASNAVAVFADPVYSQVDPRVKTPPSTPNPIPSASDQNSVDNPKPPGPDTAESEGVRFSRLRFSREEANNIIAFAQGTDSLRALDFDASKEKVLTSDLSKFRILHFATHGQLDSQRPEQSGLALSLVTKNGQRQDGFLKLRDVYRLKLNANLVVLSSCQTALGKDLRGEGLIGLTRGFMYAGVPRVIASLWSVDDHATSELMKRFYRGVLVRGLRPADALRTAQRELSTERGWSSPYYWAGFTLQGDWK